VERFGPAWGDRVEAVHGTDESAGYRGDGVGVAAEVDRRAEGFFEAFGGARAQTAEPRHGQTAPLNSVARSGCQSASRTTAYRARWSGVNECDDLG
jgi:hypothetical protein